MNRSQLRSAIICLAIAFLSSVITNAQDAPYVPGQVLIQPEDGQDINQLIEESFGMSHVAFSLKELISIPLNIYLLEFSSNGISDREIMSSLRSTREVGLAQFNHYVKNRLTTPDDALFGSQWQYVNTGQSGGTVDADIDIDEAWDITTGGLTATGDTIVVCIIDDGIDADHPDMAPNLWKNYGEIPNNGIDDDNNGFIDDYQGWDTSSNSDAVYDGGGHGTPVAGIVGAKGNNGIGVAGVNWDVKLMIVQGGTGVESEVLEAYSYPLTMRQMYNESGGSEGAFVVSTNASWGIDFGQPADAPLWCAYYDELGAQGILSCGATINGNQNVDVVGDLPTACPSDYLIAVTNMNDNDVKVTNAGYGVETIDLGAHGQNTFTVTAGGGYGGFGGTSGATPHVTGTIALLYSAPCVGLMTIAQSDPQAAADLVRDAIFDGVDPNTSLEGITSQEGRLNVATSLNLIMQNCGSCPSPYNLGIESALDVSVNLEWQSASSLLAVDLEYKEQSALEWITVAGVSSPYALTNLLTCTEYEFRLKGGCDGEESDYSLIFSFQTDGCCENPAAGGISNVTEEEAVFNWDNVLAAESYIVRISIEGADDWTEFSVSESPYSFLGLDACTDYEVQIQTICSDVLEFSESVAFTTFGCGACTDEVYCVMADGNTSDEWIAEVSIGDIVNITGASSNGYEDFSGGDVTTSLYAGDTYECVLVPGYSGTEYAEYFQVFIDLNHDGDFNDDGELVFDSGSPSVGAASGEFTVPMDATIGLTRMRVVMSYNTEPSPCEFNAQWGEAEDYCVTIQEPLTIEEELLSEWSLSPNPTSDYLFVSLSPELSNENLRITVLDVSGKTLLSQMNTPGGESRISMDLSDIASGLYFVRVSGESGIFRTQRFIKQ